MNFAPFIEFLNTNQNATFYTTSHNKPFSIKLNESKIFITIPSSKKGKPKAISLSRLESIFNLQTQTGSYKPADYNHLIGISSYILALIKEFHSEYEAFGSKINTEQEALEGYQLDSKILTRKRDRDMVIKAKERDNNQCQACLKILKFDGKFIIDCHHKNPLALTGETVTKLDDLVCLCPNCHRLAHLRTPPLSLKKIKKIISS